MTQNATINMFCLPPAGSSASIYHSWNQHIAEEIKVIPLEYPGHGRKIQENLVNEPDQLAVLLADEIIACGNHPFILFGHSVGASLLWRIENILRNHNV